MTERMIVSRVRKLKQLEDQQKEIEKQIETVKAEIRADMEAKGLEEQQAGNYIVRLTSVLTSRFDSRTFKSEHEKLYSQYIKQISTKRFSIA